MSGGSRGSEVLEELSRQGLGEAEVFAKRGRSRCFETGIAGTLATGSVEAGWAVRAGDDRRSFFVAASGEPHPAFPWPEPDGLPVKLPKPAAGATWSEPADLEVPLVSEREGFGQLAALEEELTRELPEARVLAARLQDGASESEIVSSRGIEARWRSRLATLTVDAAGPEGVTAGLSRSEREARRLDPRGLARRLADSLTVAARGTPPELDRGELLLAPRVGASLLAGLLPLFVGPRAPDRQAPLLDRRGHLGGDALTLVDDGRLAGGALEAPVDGEGLPTRKVLLVDEGVPRHPLCSWSQARSPERACGCSRRASWRDLPRPGPTHLYLRPAPKVGVGALLGSLARGYYLIDVEGAGAFDLDADRFALPVRGFAVEGGRARAPIAGAWLSGSPGAFLRGITAVARDLAFLPVDGMIGTPTLLVRGLQIQGERP